MELDARAIYELEARHTRHQMHQDGYAARRPSQRFVESLDRYAVDGIETGQFLRACLENDLMQAVCRADPEAFQELPVIMRYIHATLPGNSWGDKQHVEDWMDRKKRLLANAASEGMGLSVATSDVIDRTKLIHEVLTCK